MPESTSEVEDIQVGPGGEITISYNDIGGRDTTGQTILLTPSTTDPVAGTAEWSCNANKIAVDGFGTTGTVRPEFVPASCRP